MSHFECCKTKPFPSSYFICINCCKGFHRSCVMKDNTKFKFIEGHKIECCKKNGPISSLLKEKSVLEDTISELNENSFLQDQHVNRLKSEHKKFIEEVSIREEELNALIRNQEKIIRDANRELQILKDEIRKFTQKSFISHATQTDGISYCSSESQTEKYLVTKSNQSTSNANNSIAKSSVVPSNNYERKLILIAGNQGKELVHFLRGYATDFSVSSIIKTNATNYELVQTAIEYSRHLTKDDYLVLWPEENSFHLFGKLYSQLNHLNFFILTTPNRYDSVILNEKVYYSNLSLYKKMHSTMGSLDSLINVNCILRRSNYGYKGDRIRKTGKRYIALHLANRIQGGKRLSTSKNITLENCLEQINQTEKIETSGNTSTNYNSESPSSGSSVEVLSSRCLAEELNITSPFLYPRLSQVSFED